MNAAKDSFNCEFPKTSGGCKFRMVSGFNGSPDELEGDLRTLYKKIHGTIKKVTNDTK